MLPSQPISIASSVRFIGRSIVALVILAAIKCGSGRLLAQAADDDPANWTWQRRGAATQDSSVSQVSEDTGQVDGEVDSIPNRREPPSSAPNSRSRPARRRSLLPVRLSSFQPTVSVKAPSISPQTDAGELPPPAGVPHSGGGPSLGPEILSHPPANTRIPTGGEYFDYDTQLYHESGCPSGNCGGPFGWDPFGASDGCCGCDSCDRCDTWFSARAETLVWWGKGDHLPPLVTTSPVGTPRTIAGVLGEPSTVVRFGDTDVDDQVRLGGRLTLDAWLTCNQRLGIEASCFILRDRKFSFSDSSDPIIARPFFNVESLRQDAQLIAYPGFATGSINICAKSELQGADILLRGNWFEDCCRRLDFLVGFRYLRLAESLTINSQSTTIPIDDDGSEDPTINVRDQFHTLNRFNGIEFGAVFERRNCRWSFDFLMKLALGSTNERVSIDGSTVFADGQTATAAPGGLLAAPSNIGTYDRDVFTVVPELGVAVGYDVTCHLRTTLGYTFLYWSQVARPADQIDLNVNPGGGAFPQFNFHCADYWAQGFNLGLEYHY
jgi:hypothetical protein